MGSQRSLLQRVTTGHAKRLHRCRANAKHQLVKGDPILIIKVDRNTYHYCADCARKFIATARSRLADLERGLAAAPTVAVPRAS